MTDYIDYWYDNICSSKYDPASDIYNHIFIISILAISLLF